MKLSIPFEEVQKLKLGTKEVSIGDGATEKVAVVSFEAKLNPAEFARAVMLYAQNAPLEVVIESPQAHFDLKIEKVNLETGELAKV